MADNSSGNKKPEAQGLNRGPLLPAKMVFKEDGQVIGQGGQREGGFGGPEGFQAESGQGEALLEFFDDVFTVGATVIVAPYLQRTLAGWKTGDQCLKEIAGGRPGVFCRPHFSFPPRDAGSGPGGAVVANSWLDA